MKIAIHHPDNVNSDSYSFKWIEALKKRNIKVDILDLRDTDIIKKICGYNGVMWHWFHVPDDKQIAPKILQAIELGLDIPVFPNLETRWHYDEKVAQHYLFDAIKAPKIKSWVFWNYEEALKFIDKCSYPIIFKLSVGAGSANVLKLNSCYEAKEILEKMFIKGFFPYTINEFAKQPISNKKSVKPWIKKAIKYIINSTEMGDSGPSIPWYYLIQKNYAYFQEFLPDNPFDIRITVIGNRAFGFIRYNRSNDFRASGSGNIDYDLSKIPMDAVRIAHQISIENKFQSMAYDFLLDTEGQVRLNEISYCYVNKAIYNCPGYWNRGLEWHEGHIWPEEAQVEDFLYYINTGNLI
jgi:hypothetical protein